MKKGDKFKFNISLMKENNINTDSKDGDVIHTVLDVVNEKDLGVIIGYKLLHPNCPGYYVQINECWCIPIYSSTMDYSNEVNKLLKDLFFEDWMDENDWTEFLDEFFRQTGTSIQSLCDDIKIGVNNGYSVKYQINALKLIFKKA